MLASAHTTAMKPSPLFLRLAAACLGLGTLAGGASVAAADFSKDIRPVLESRCLQCHGGTKAENALCLDSRREALKGGDHGPVWVAGKAETSLLFQVVSGSHPELARMPKKSDPLPPATMALLKEWINQGAVWPDSVASIGNATVHWAFQPVHRPVPPRPEAAERRWVRNPVDAFIAARLGAEQLHPSPEADRVTLIRRVSLDLTGLPPTPEEVDAFVADHSSDAWKKVVERLLKSPHYGEKWGRHWLDVARYADSNGFEKDRTRSIWPYRDWVIRALNRDLPFDQFSRDQLAGDLVPDATLEQRVATGFLRNSMVNMEGGIEPEKFRVETIIDRVDAVGRAWLGLTIACAQCHSHKYDPISQTEYYRFYDFLNQDCEPMLDVPNADQLARRAAIQSNARGAMDRLWADASVKGRFESWLAGVRELPSIWKPIDAKEWHSQPMKFEKQEDLSLLGGGDVYNSGVLRVWVDVPDQGITGFRLETLNDANLPFNGPGLTSKGDFLITEFTVEATPLRELQSPEAGSTKFVGTTNLIRFRRAVADVEAAGLPAMSMIDGVTTNGGWGSAFTRGRRNQERRAVFEAEKPAGFEGGTRLLLTVHSKPQGGLNASSDRVSNFIPGRLRLSLTTANGTLAADPLSARQRAWLSRPPDQWTPAQERELFETFVFQDPALAEATKQWDALWKDWPDAENTTLALEQRPVRRATRLFKRGDWQKPTTEVTAGVPASLNPLPAGAPANRLGLAQWLVSRENPLTARVIVNRIWMQYFGQGLVITPEDFGTRAEKPSHPELLDWLASEFMDRGWSLKELHRLIVNSATYRQSSRIPPVLLEKDPYNRLIARGPRVRVDGESVQDIALKASGLLSEKIGGPSVFPPLPDGVMALAYGPIAWNVSEGDDRYRRAMYTFWKRSVPHPVLLTFDAPPAEQSCPRRMRSNTPLQALTTLNEPTFNQAARWLAWRALQVSAKSDADRAAWVFRQCVSRRPEPGELTTLVGLLGSARSEFTARPRDAAQFAFADPKNPAPLPTGMTIPDLAAWSTVARAVLNLDETITKE